MALEGELRVALHLAGAQVVAVALRSTRPDVAQRLLQGRTRAEVMAAVPQIFSLCGRSQAAACALACDAALGLSPTPESLVRSRAAVAAEMVREASWHTLLQWPRWLGEVPSAQALAAARASTSFDAAGSSADATQQVAESIAQAVLGMPAQEWLALDTPTALAAWAQAGSTASARFVAQLVAQDLAGRGGMSATALLPAQGHTQWVVDLAAAAAADPAFARQPLWRGQPAESGALARRQHDPLIQALQRSGASALPARFVARLQELALLLTRQLAPELGALTLPDGTGLAWVENARGLLLHQARLAADRVTAYGIVAPTEWNFHPRGALVQTLMGVAAADKAALQRHAQCLIHSLDPCVACHVEFCDA